MDVSDIAASTGAHLCRAKGVGLAAAFAGALLCSASAQAQTFKPGTIVLGSPTHSNTGFVRCEVMGVTSATSYDLDCAERMVTNSGVKLYTKRYNVHADWIKPNDSAHHPDRQLGAIRAAEGKSQAAPAAARPAAARPAANPTDGGPVPLGAYQCFGGASAGNLKLNFRSRSQYSNEQGTVGAYTQSGPTIAFKTGPWAGFYGHVFANGRVQLSTAPGRASTMSCQLR